MKSKNEYRKILSYFVAVAIFILILIPGFELTLSSKAVSHACTISPIEKPVTPLPSRQFTEGLRVAAIGYIPYFTGEDKYECSSFFTAWVCLVFFVLAVFVPIAPMLQAKYRLPPYH